jgi:hypothetical protein
MTNLIHGGFIFEYLSKGDNDSIAGVGFEPTTFGLCLPLRLSPPDDSVCGLDFPFALSLAEANC